MTPRCDDRSPPAQVFVELDRDGSGEVSFEEFAPWFRHFTAHNGATAQRSSLGVEGGGRRGALSGASTAGHAHKNRHFLIAGMRRNDHAWEDGLFLDRSERGHGGGRRALSSASCRLEASCRPSTSSDAGGRISQDRDGELPAGASAATADRTAAAEAVGTTAGVGGGVVGGVVGGGPRVGPVGRTPPVANIVAGVAGESAGTASAERPAAAEAAGEHAGEAGEEAAREESGLEAHRPSSAPDRTRAAPSADSSAGARSWPGELAAKQQQLLATQQVRACRSFHPFSRTPPQLRICLSTS